MKKIKNIIAIMLTVSILLSCVAVGAYALDKKCNCEHCPSIVVPGLFQSDEKFLDENGNSMVNKNGELYTAPFFMEPTDEIVALALEEALLPVASLLITQKDKEGRAAQAIADVLGKALLSNLELDEYGHPIKNVDADKYDTSLANLAPEQVKHCLDAVPLDLYVDIAGLDHLYFLSYLHTGNIKDIAYELYDLIQIAKEETGHDKVNLVPISQGGSVENALMQVYKDKGLNFADDINRVCYVVPAADGAYVLGDIYHYGFIDEPEALYGYMLPSLLGKDQDYLAYLINLLLRLFPNADLNNILDTAVDTLIEDYLEYSTCLWALIPSYDYEVCRDRYLSDPEDVHIREQTDWYFNAQVNSRKYILEAKAQGVEFFDIVDYNSANYKIFDSWNTKNGDGVIHTDSEAFGATTEAFDTPLPEDYVQAGTYCTDPTHNHMDERRLIDASTGVMCETTFYFRDQGHESTASNDVIMRLAIRILTDESFEDVYSDPAYPQFNYARISKSVIETYEEWEDYDTSELSPEDALEFEEAKTELKVAIDSTYMPTEEFDAAAERFEAVIYKIENGEEMPGGRSLIVSIFAQVLKQVNTALINNYGGKGYSEIAKDNITEIVKFLSK